ncbi:MAG TPA: CheR family methyltransferase, partial [Puia sp.]|nr:CheR family methyltransferase [Puia sp.]
LPVFRPEKGYHFIDHFFTTLAGVYKNNAFAIILSGTGADGTAGVRAIRTEGGITFAQDDTAAFRGMPQYAIESGFIDFVLSPEAIAGRLEALKSYTFRNGAILRHLDNSKVQLSRIYLLLADKYGVDFSLYKQSSVNRRIIRRMTLNRIPNVEMYVKHLEADPHEIDLLYKDLLSGAGGFFREPLLGRILTKKIFPFILRDRKPDDPVRIWIPACSGGEEACSMAIYLLEYMRAKDMQVPVQIFATDLNDVTIEMARTGFYTRSAVQHISPLRLKKFFVKLEGGYQIVKTVRDMCIFATHNFLKDPPYARMDIISCQHALLSLEQSAQHKALQAFHYALKPAGFLMLDRKDNLGEPERFFVRSFKEWNIYVKRKDLPHISFNFSFDDPQTAGGGKSQASSESEALSERGKTADRIMLSRYVPAGILIDGEGHILRFYGVTAPYFRPQTGKATLELLKIVHEDLAPELRMLLTQARRQGIAVSRTGILINTDTNTIKIAIEVIPIRREDETLMLIVIRDGFWGTEGTRQTDAEESDREEIEHIRQLEESLMEAGRQMIAMHEEFDRIREDLQAAHEELLSSNEELQSINEELEVSKEDLQSSNEELITVNEEMTQRNIELRESTEYAETIVETIRQPLFDLYSDLRIRKANKALYTLFRLQTDEVEGNYLNEVAGGAFNIGPLIDNLRFTISKRVAFEDLELKCDVPGMGERIILFNATRINGQPGKRARILLVMEDVTERKLLEKKKDEFISIASHELKTPVTNIQAYTQILYNEFMAANDPRSVQLVSKLHGQVTRLTNLTRDLLDMTRISQGQLQLKETFFDVKTMAAEIVEEMQLTTPLRLVLAPASSVPKFWGDRERLGQVVQNLVSNAIKYSPIDRQVIISLGMQDKNVCLSVQDFGMGMTPETQEKIFDRFFRENASAQKHPGLGLGLYISHEIVRQHGGTITVQSGKDKGSTFTVTLPIRKDLSSVV